jgi:hypothetical protein
MKLAPDLPEPADQIKNMIAAVKLLSGDSPAEAEAGRYVLDRLDAMSPEEAFSSAAALLDNTAKNTKFRTLAGHAALDRVTPDLFQKSVIETAFEAGIGTDLPLRERALATIGKAAGSLSEGERGVLAATILGAAEEPEYAPHKDWLQQIVDVISMPQEKLAAASAAPKKDPMKGYAGRPRKRSTAQVKAHWATLSRHTPERGESTRQTRRPPRGLHPGGT